ncbi:MAG: AAA family ATPase [Subdoligranulum variabile]|uniref:AAA family ATPase n=1 Tax=Gemmiger sp. TaxID=2049027 RepID=UPI002A90DC1C|nr:AAA family ATPase [Gemmiger sp.]MDD7638843.1 AAA family ATPase [Subdoligranulum variabile]MDY5605374.1 AAA family ATPase [Gemmiger sp.]
MGVVIDKIAFENYRQYGTGSLSFRTNGDALLSVLIAKNGTGKTTLLNAITWCLYDKELHLADEKTALPLVNAAAARSLPEGSLIPVSVAITILDGNNIVEFYRAMNFKTSIDSAGNPRYIPGKSKFTVSITPIGDFENTQVLQGIDADVVAKQYFDEAIFKFYFFDGEKLRDFFAAGQSNTIQQSIFNISQVTMLENACGRLKRMHYDRTKKLAKDCPDIAALNEEREKQEKRLATARETLSDSRADVLELTHKRDELDEILRGYDPIKKLQQERQDLESTLRHVEDEEETYRSDRSAFIRQYTVLLTLYPRIKKTLDLIGVKEADGDLPPAIDKDQVRRLLDHLDEPCPLCNGVIGETGRAHLEALLEKISVSSHTSNYLKEIKGPLERYLEQAQNFKKELASLRQREMDIEERKNVASQRLQQITSTLSNFESESGQLNVAKTEAERTAIIQRINVANQAIGAANTTIAACNERLAQIEAAVNKALQTMNEHADIRKQLEVIDMLHGQFTKIKNQIMDEMKAEIEKTTWDIFDSMIWKKQTFGRIEIDDSYDIAVYNTDGIEMTGSLSATEQMALAYAFTLAIHRASGKNCPLVIDSPLGRVSDDNRENMARALLEVSRDKQIIMLFTPDEYSAAVRQMYDVSAEVRELALSEDESFVEGIDH